MKYFLVIDTAKSNEDGPGEILDVRIYPDQLKQFSTEQMQDILQKKFRSLCDGNCLVLEMKKISNDIFEIQE